MPSLGGPPLPISVSGTLWRSKFVFQPARLNCSTWGAADGFAGTLAEGGAGPPGPQALARSSAPAAPLSAPFIESQSIVRRCAYR